MDDKTDKTDEGPERLDGGWMTLSEAAYWIATEGGAKEIDPSTSDYLKPAVSALLSAIAKGQVAVQGRPDGIDVPQLIEAFKFSRIPFVAPYEEPSLALLKREAPHILTVGLVPEDHWEPEFNDKLVGKKGTKFSHIQVKCGDVAKLWPFFKAIKANKHRIKTEKEAISILSEALKKNNNLSRGEAKSMIEGCDIGARAFQNRVWPKARELAGLDPIAPPGAKPKNRYV